MNFHSATLPERSTRSCYIKEHIQSVAEPPRRDMDLVQVAVPAEGWQDCRWIFHFIFTRVESYPQEAEMWCVDHCKGNRFWRVDEVMWFCIKCQFWYHLDCCNIKPSKRSYNTLGDILSTPLLRGGAFHVDGTAPCIYSAAKLIEMIQADRKQSPNNPHLTPVTHCDFKQTLKVWLGYQAAEPAKLSIDIECPKCGRWSDQ